MTQDRPILFLASQPIAPSDGATISMLERLSYLKLVFGWRTQCLCCARSEDRDGLMRTLGNFGCRPVLHGNRLEYEARGVQVTAVLGPGLDRFNVSQWHHITALWKREISEISPHVIFSNMRDLPATNAAVRHRHLVFMTEDEYTRPADAESMSLPVSPATVYREVKSAAVASRFLQMSLQASWGVAAQVLANPVDLERLNGIGGKTDSFISILHPYIHKGIELFLQIAKGSPQRKFLVAGGLGAEYRAMKPVISSFPNVTLVPYQPDIRAIYERSRIVLVPSLWNEAFSRIVVEACAAGLPVLASDVGGLREAGEDAAIYLPVRQARKGEPFPIQDPAPWLQAINELDDPGRYSAASAQALARARRYGERVTVDMQKLNNLIQADSERS